MAATRSKFQISQTLDERVHKILNSSEEFKLSTNADELDIIYILGFHYSNVTNYVGLTRNYHVHNAGLRVVGMLLLKCYQEPAEVIKNKVRSIKEFYSNPDEGLGTHSVIDKNEHLYLIYYSPDSNEIVKKVYDSNEACFIEEQPKLSVLKDAKIYTHSVLVKVIFVAELGILRDQLEEALGKAKLMLSNDTKDLTLSLRRSNFSTKTPLSNKSALDTLYACLDTPDEVLKANDYLPQLDKKEKSKMIDKWHNKVKDQRMPMEFELSHSKLTHVSDEPKHKVKFEEYLYLQANDSVRKSTQIILFLLRQRLELLKIVLSQKQKSKSTDDSLANDDLKFCSFLPTSLNHFIYAIYPLPSKPDFDLLEKLRCELHEAYCITLDQPVVRFSQRVINTDLTNDDEIKGYLCNVHKEIVNNSGIKTSVRNIVSGTYTYHHYLQDRTQDNGWGCAYRSLQTIISWFKHKGYIYSPDVAIREPKSSGDELSKSLRERLHSESRVPTHNEIQSVLVSVGDKQPNFIGSQKWIGSQEVCYVLNHLYDIDSKFISVSSGSELVYQARDLGNHFETQSCPVMIGGGVLAHTILGIDFNEKNGDISYLILDPHYTGPDDLGSITKKGWCGWKKNSFWDKNAFYNLCLPQTPREF